MPKRTLLSLNISSLTLDPKNARKHGDTDIQAIAASLERFGQQTPIVVTADNIVVKGNGTLLAAKSLGWTKIDALRTDLTGEQVAAYSIADNRTAELSDWDNEVLLELLQGFDDQSLLDACGFDEEALAALVEEVHPEPDPVIEEDEIPDPPPEPITKPGDLWLLGKHRLLCGDSTVAEDVARLMDGAKADLCFTSPPYAAGRVIDRRVVAHDPLRPDRQRDGRGCGRAGNRGAGRCNCGSGGRDGRWRWLGRLRLLRILATTKDEQHGEDDARHHNHASGSGREPQGEARRGERTPCAAEARGNAVVTAPVLGGVFATFDAEDREDFADMPLRPIE